MQLKMHDDSFGDAVDVSAVLAEYASLSSEWF